MSAITDIFTGNRAAKAAGRSAAYQAKQADKAIDFQKETLKQTRADLSPFKKAGTAQLNPLKANINELRSIGTNPQAQLDYVQSNPFFDSLANRAKGDLFKAGAAGGKLGSGGTAAALQDRLLQLGESLISNQYNRVQGVVGARQNLASAGQNAAAMTGNAAQNTANQVTDLLGQRGNAVAAGIQGKAAGYNQALSGLGQGGDILAGMAGGGFGGGFNQGVSSGLFGSINPPGYTFQASDVRVKDDVERIGALDNGLPVYRFKYKGDDTPRIGVMAQDVEKVLPRAVKEIDGVKFVNYGAL